MLSAFAALWLGHGAGAQTAELVMVEQHGCHWCEAWNAEVAAIYPKTAEGRFAPLRRIDLRAPVPMDLSLDGRAVFTPTFILVQDGRELARMEGYGGDELFWWGLSALLAEHTDFKGGEGE
ncbi:hypothetical protein DKT77_11870 [Meridianimarinicoccus roseus]|uniref:Thioredoxin family protein n=1 Tax=Meridianimarinicoccus roseus TaxID=2072018 RepID=A0A2V2LEV0_9RHOB|nr:hypothetical protein [Meridianimarinicoccus roseus]PWR02401.1 hypothetical protein DKT77_11870 [Meridianimarinicoccus roseus]